MLYHQDVYFPSQWQASFKNVKTELYYGRHALLAADNDRYGRIDLPKEITFSFKNIVEVETDSFNNIIKVVVRLSYDSKHDITLAVLKNGFVKTVWLNLKTDIHRTLDKSKYVNFSQKKAG